LTDPLIVSDRLTGDIINAVLSLRDKSRTLYPNRGPTVDLYTLSLVSVITRL